MSQLLKNASVSGRATADEKGNTTLTITVNDIFEHQFPSTSRVSKALGTADIDSIVARLDGGSFFFVDDQMVDFRYSDYQGFVHNQDSIEKLIEVIGITRSEDELEGVSRNTAARNIKLSKEWASEEFEVANLGAGDFKTAIHYGWSPFSQNVNSAFVLWRLICANGMRGMTNFLNSTIPLVNNWEEHLEMANRQLMNTINGKMNERINALQNQRASVADCLLISNHVADRADGIHNVISQEQTARLNMIGALVNPVLHLKDVYKSEVFQDNAMASRAPAHITGYDFFNMITELRTHTDPTADSTGHALDVVANQLLFGGDSYYGHKAGNQVEQSLVANDAPALIINNPDQAFFGK